MKEKEFIKDAKEFLQGEGIVLFCNYFGMHVDDLEFENTNSQDIINKIYRNNNCKVELFDYVYFIGETEYGIKMTFNEFIRLLLDDDFYNYYFRLRKDNEKPVNFRVKKKFVNKGIKKKNKIDESWRQFRKIDKDKGKFYRKRFNSNRRKYN